MWGYFDLNFDSSVSFYFRVFRRCREGGRIRNSWAGGYCSSTLLQPQAPTVGPAHSRTKAESHLVDAAWPAAEEEARWGWKGKGCPSSREQKREWRKLAILGKYYIFPSPEVNQGTKGLAAMGKIQLPQPDLASGSDSTTLNLGKAHPFWTSLWKSRSESLGCSIHLGFNIILFPILSPPQPNFLRMLFMLTAHIHSLFFW